MHSEKKAESLADFEKYIIPEFEKHFNSVKDKIKLELSKDNKLLSPDLLFKRELDKSKEILKEYYNEYALKIEKGFEAINQHKEKVLEKELFDRFQEELKKSSENIITLIKSKFEDRSPFELIKSSDLTMNCFQKIAYALFNIKEFEKAANIYFILTILNPQNKDYWTSLGMAEKMNGQFGEAIGAFSMVIILDSADPLPHLSLADLYINMNEKKMAEFELNEAEKLIKNGDFNQLKTVVTGLRVKTRQL